MLQAGHILPTALEKKRRLSSPPDSPLPVSSLNSFLASLARAMAGGFVAAYFMRCFLIPFASRVMVLLTEIPMFVVNVC